MSYRHTSRRIKKIEKEPIDKEPNDKEKDENFFSKHPAFTLFLIFIYFSVLGLIYNYVLFTEFQINILEFIEIPDFLVLSFKQPVVALFPILILVYILLLIFSNALYEISISLNKILARVMYIFIVIVTASTIVVCLELPYIVYLLGDSDANKIEIGIGQKVICETKSLTEIEQERDTIFLIGSTNKFYFFYDKKRESAFTINSDDIVRIDFFEHHSEIKEVYKLISDTFLFF